MYGEADFSEYDMLVLPGGMPGTKHLEAHGGLMEHHILTRSLRLSVYDIPCHLPGLLRAAEDACDGQGEIHGRAPSRQPMGIPLRSR